MFTETLLEFLKEDLAPANTNYLEKLPRHVVQCELKVKSPLVMAGLPFFTEVFELVTRYLNLAPLPVRKWDNLRGLEGASLTPGKKEELLFELPFAVVITGERLALNLLARASAVATATKVLVDLAKPHGIKIFDTRKTTPGLRFLEKYAVTVGGGYNHRFSQTDAWMIKDNHKNALGGLLPAVQFFQGLHGAYHPLILEIHSLEELKMALEQTSVRHLLLDNFTKAQIQEAVKLKSLRPEVTYEVSGGITPITLQEFLIPGVDAMSVGKITQFPGPVDLSLKTYA